MWPWGISIQKEYVLLSTLKLKIVKVSKYEAEKWKCAHTTEGKLWLYATTEQQPTPLQTKVGTRVMKLVLWS